MTPKFNMSKLLFSQKTLRPFEAKFSMEPPWDENLFRCSGLHDQDGFQALYGKKPSNISFFGTKRPMTLKLGIQHRALKYYHNCSNDEPGLTFSIFICFLMLLHR